MTGQGRVRRPGRRPADGQPAVRVLVDNPQGRLTIGQSVRVSIVVEEHKATSSRSRPPRSSTWAKGRS